MALSGIKDNKNGSLSGIWKLLVPNWYAASIYLIFIFFLAIWIFQIGLDANKAAYAPKAPNAISYDRYTGMTQGDIVLTDNDIPNLTLPKETYRGHRYKVFVVMRSYRKSELHYVKQLGSVSRHSVSYNTVAVPSKEIEGPSIICIGHNLYAFIDAPRVERDGFLNLSSTDKNKIKKIGVFEPDLDVSLYSTDCRPPDKAVVDQLGLLFNVRLPETRPTESD